MRAKDKHEAKSSFALVANKVLSFEDGLRLVSKRAMAMQKACDQGLRLAFLIGFPCSVGMSVLAKPVFGFLYLLYELV